MIREKQDLAWKCLPKEERNKIISAYACNRTSGNQYNYEEALSAGITECLKLLEKE